MERKTWHKRFINFGTFSLATPADKGGPNEGSVGKSLQISPAPGEGSGYFINAYENIKASNTKKQVSVSLTEAEFYTLKRIGDFAIPFLLGMDLCLTTHLPEAAMGPPPMGGQYMGPPQGYVGPGSYAPMGGQPGPY